MIILGLNAGNHSASACLYDSRNRKLLFASEAERFGRRLKNDPELNSELIEETLKYGMPDQITWWQNPFRSASRRIFSGERPIFQTYRDRINKFPELRDIPVKFTSHHRAHAAHSFYTSGYKEAMVLIVDAIGETECASIWKADESGLKKLWSSPYPHSIGLLYSAVTQHLGLKPAEEEYIVMGMASYGTPKYAKYMEEDLFVNGSVYSTRLKSSPHKGLREYFSGRPWAPEDIAASIQSITEKYISHLVSIINYYTPVNFNLCVGGGVALNCVAMSKLINKAGVRSVWITPGSGDQGLAMGSILAHNQSQVFEYTPYLGYDIKRKVDPKDVADALKSRSIVALANGRAEFGPRALGNRSLLGLVSDPDIKNKMNEIKRRQKFRPFAGAMSEASARQYFHQVPSYPHVHTQMYMQMVSSMHDTHRDYVSNCCHVDGTSRIQIIEPGTPGTLLGDVIAALGPNEIVLNTSLNIKGQPIVNTWDQALEFSKIHNVPVF